MNDEFKQQRLSVITYMPPFIDQSTYQYHCVDGEYPPAEVGCK